ncbi:EamA family transporter [Tolumonas lignilytica]|jgi:Permeases of the drug/metabolite transporter (DMT) superfamily|uniref:EamA family transporter n=1 Tax=Tolumonas lignilytica TaxID=1283284 RepID=UPI0004AC86BA
MFPILALTGAMLLWSSAFISLKYLLDFFHPTQIVFFRMLIASACFLFFGKKLLQFRYQKGDWRWLLIMGIAEPCLYFLFETSALQYTTAGQAGVITATLPLLASVTAFLVLKERIGKLQIMGFIVAIVGCSALSFAGQHDEQASNPVLGNCLEFMAMLCGAVYSVSIRKLSSRYSSVVLTAFQALVGVLFFGPLAMQHTVPTHASLLHWGSLLYLGTVVTIGAYWLYNWAISQVTVSLATAYINLIPVFTLLLAFWLLGERLNFWQGLACGVVFIGVVISQLPEKSPITADRAISDTV